MKKTMLVLVWAWAATAAAADGGAKPPGKVDVEAVKEKYWARGDESELGVVQNRMFSKTMKIEAGLLGGTISSDPFLNVRSLGGSLGFHLTEAISLHGYGWKSFASPSSALVVFEETRGATTNTNKPSGFAGGELLASLIYGKLSLLGAKIIHYDLHLSAGAGVTITETGNYLTPAGGIGQKIFAFRNLALRIDYRLMPYREDIEEKVIPTKLGQVVATRTNWSHGVTLGVTYMFGLKKDEGESE